MTVEVLAVHGTTLAKRLGYQTLPEAPLYTLTADASVSRIDVRIANHVASHAF